MMIATISLRLVTLVTIIIMIMTIIISIAATTTTSIIIDYRCYKLSRFSDWSTHLIVSQLGIRN